MNDFDNDFENDPFRSPMEAPSGDSGRGLITAVAVVNYIFGGLCLSCGVCFGVLGGGVLALFLAGDGPQMDEPAKMGVGIGAAVIIGMMAVQMLVGLLVILAGYGVQNYRQWGRILTIVLAVVSALLGVFSLLQLSPIGLLQIGYAVFALVVMLNPHYTKEFQ
ncbi:hypothetical protein [Blastopirellula marina]|uniref:DUF4064 domain-containing protein n=1 Tax=Blastopirellula marina TaxID=124 RepID=A0A2S8GU07_9BACT|nr:hypothetical protein [Blastopirellula marina]PQO47890.1 hypothetical protein C5Y93_02300 [Blastopirellula marina]